MGPKMMGSERTVYSYLVRGEKNGDHAGITRHGIGQFMKTIFIFSIFFSTKSNEIFFIDSAPWAASDLSKN